MPPRFAAAHEFLTQIQQDLHTAKEFQEILRIRDRCEAAKHITHLRDDFEVQNEIRVLKVLAERKLGDYISSWKNSNSKRCKKQSKLSELGVKPHQSKRWQKVASVPEREFQRYVTIAKLNRVRVSSAAVIRLAIEGKRVRTVPKTYEARMPAPEKGERRVCDNSTLLDEMHEQVLMLVRILKDSGESGTAKTKALVDRLLTELLENIAQTRVRIQK